MKIKGVSVTSLQKYAQEKLNPEKYQAWLNSLEPETKQIFTDDILASSWFDMKKISIEPEIKLAEIMAVADHKRFAWDLGRYNAEQSLKGIYKLFVQIGTPAFIISRASRILPTYYQPSRLEVTERGKDFVVLTVLEFPEMDEIIENRICGWIEQALEICGCKEIKIEIKRSLTRGDNISEYKISWK